jgi:membrane protein
LNVKQMQDLYLDLNRLSGNRLVIIRDALASFSEARGSQAAASLAYYAILSLFPLLLVVIVAASYFVDSTRVYMNVVDSVERIIPASPQLIEENLRHVLEERESVGALVLLALFWSASGVFTNLAYNINLAWTHAPPRNFLDRYLVGLGMVLVLGSLLLAAITLDWLVHLVPLLDRLGSSSSWEPVWIFLSGLGSWVVVYLLFLALYWWIPTVRISWRTAVWAALVASAGWKLATSGFAWYLKSGLDRYKLVYGSLGAIIALLFLIYLIALITLFCAHLAAAIDHREQERRKNTVTVSERSMTSGHL